MEKNLENKLKILSDAAKYDVSCSSSGSERKNVSGGTGSAYKSGICHSWSSDGRCISLLKILMTNNCIYNCEYCINRKDNDIPRATLSPEEIVELTMNFYRRNYIEGLFLSSGIIKNADYTMEKLIKIAEKLRLEEKFNGYIHMKVIPGASEELIYKLGMYADRVSVNTEIADNRALRLLAPQKKVSDIIKSMSAIRDKKMIRLEENKLYKHTPKFVPAGQTTQIIVGASGESDYNIINKSENLYKDLNLKRVYYSAYVPVNTSGILAHVKAAPMLREHRLYQADWLLRFYNFKADEILSSENPFFDTLLDPKANWALNNWEKFPIEINKASYNDLLRIPGIGVTSALRILKARKYGEIRYENLQKIGVVLKRAKYFITVSGKFYGFKNENLTRIRNAMIDMEKINVEQISFLDYNSRILGNNLIGENYE